MDTTRHVCTLPASLAQYPGQACPACGHTNLVHPGAHNTALTECAVCAMLAVTEQARAQLEQRGE